MGKSWGRYGEQRLCGMKYEYEEQAMRNEPMPEGMTAFDSLVYTFLRNLYWSLHHGVITREQGQIEKNKTLAQFEQTRAARELERRCWELSAKRTLAADHAMMMYRKNRTLENADNLVSKLEWLDDEIAAPVKTSEHGANCPVCNKFFNQDHADRKPTFCEDCGCKLVW